MRRIPGELLHRADEPIDQFCCRQALRTPLADRLCRPSETEHLLLCVGRFVEEAFDQGALLTQLDLAVLLGVGDATVSKYVLEIQREGTLLPTRGNIQNMSGAITHKREIITL